MQNNHYLENLEKRAQKREEKKKKAKEMKVSGKSILELQRIIKKKNDAEKTK